MSKRKGDKSRTKIISNYAKEIFLQVRNRGRKKKLIFQHLFLLFLFTGRLFWCFTNQESHNFCHCKFVTFAKKIPCREAAYSLRLKVKTSGFVCVFCRRAHFS